MGETLSLDRRSFLKWSGAVAGTTALVGASSTRLGMPSLTTPAHAVEGREDVDKTVWSGCLVNCGSRCPLRLQVKDGTVVRVLPDNTGTDEIGSQQIRACVRGRSIRHRTYSPDRLKKPLRRRPGTKRGEGVWDEISWDEALDYIASEWKRILKDYGPAAVHYQYASGVIGATLEGHEMMDRLLNCTGGSLGEYGTYSAAQFEYALGVTYGGAVFGHSNDDHKNSKLIVWFGYNPHEMRMSGGGELFITKKIREESNVRTIVIDPRYSDTALTIADEWIPIRPGTDAALVAALIYELIKHNLIDQEYLDRCCLGFDEDHMPPGIPAGMSYRTYVMGQGQDKTPKTPEWASKITGIPAERIIRLAKEIGTNKPCAIAQGWGPQRQANGENTVRAIMTLANAIGGVGIPGGDTDSFPGNASLPMVNSLVMKNPVKAKISCFTWPDAIDHGPEMTRTKDGVMGADKLDVPIKLIFNHAGNCLVNQHSDINGTIKLLQDDSKCELIVNINNVMDATAQYSDVVLPDTSSAEREDICFQKQAGPMGYVLYQEKAIEPLFDSRNASWICTELAKRMGVEKEFTAGLDKEGWIKKILADSRAKIPDLPDLPELKKMGVFRKNMGTVVPLQKFRQDPEGNPLGTPSGKVEIFSLIIAKYMTEWQLPEGDRLTAIPEYVPTWEGVEERSDELPLQMIGHHFKGRTHSSYVNVDWIQDAYKQTVWINTMDAEARGIKNDDEVYVFNKRGKIKVLAHVTPRIAPGVCSVPQGAWYKPNKDGVDEGGCVNTLTKYHPSPLAKGNPQHTNLVQIEKA